MKEKSNDTIKEGDKEIDKRGRKRRKEKERKN